MELHASARGVARLTLLLLLQLVARGTTGLRLALPQGASGGQLVIREGESLTLSCEDAGDVRLSHPAYTIYEETMPEVVHRRTNQRWNATLHLRNARPAHSGYYNCSSGSNPRDMDSVYVYVKSSSQRPWVLDSDDMRRENKVSQYSARLHTTATLDCRPNDPSTSVRLRDAKNRTLSLGRQPDGTELSWDPRIGFRLGPVEMRHSGTYWCAAENSPRDLQVKLQVVGVDLVAPTVWFDRESPLVDRGSDVTITCELAMVSSVDFNLTWSSPTGRVNEGYRWLSYGVANDSRSWHRRTKLLYVFNVKESDAGDYTCTADDARGNKRSATFRLQVKGGPGETASVKQSSVTHTSAGSGGGGNGGHNGRGSSSGGLRLTGRAEAYVATALSVVFLTLPGRLRSFS